MPHAERKVKRIVSTYFEKEDNPLRSARIEGNMPDLPFFVGSKGVECLKNGLADDWDVIIVGDGEDPGLVNLTPLTGSIEVLWLFHDQECTRNQVKKLKAFLGKDSEFHPIPFHHGKDCYDRYLSKVAQLWQENGAYSDRLKQLDYALRAEQLESDISDTLWLLFGWFCGFKKRDTFNAAQAKYDRLITWFDETDRKEIAACWKAITEMESSSPSPELYANLKNALRVGLHRRVPA